MLGPTVADRKSAEKERDRADAGPSGPVSHIARHRSAYKYHFLLSAWLMEIESPGVLHCTQENHILQ